MSRMLEIALSTTKDAEIARYLQLTKEESISPIIISAIEYYLLTDGYLNIGDVCINNPGETSSKKRLRIYVPNKTIVEPWVQEQLSKRRGILTLKIKSILRNSLRIVEKTEQENYRSYEECLQNVEQAEKRTKKYEMPAVVQTKAEPDIPPVYEYVKPEERSTKNNEKNTLMNKLMPQDIWD